MKKKIMIVLTIIGIIFFISSIIVGIRYEKYKNILGEYQPMSESDENLKLELYKWTRGRKEDLKCDLWNCEGYSTGKYEIKGTKIIFHLNSGYIDCDYKLEKENDKTILVLDYGNNNINKYVKIK